MDPRCRSRSAVVRGRATSDRSSPRRHSSALSPQTADATAVANRLRVTAHEMRTGFLFTNLSEGTKYVNIEMVHDRGAIRDGFFFQLPSGRFDYERAQLGPEPAPSPRTDLTIAQLRNAVETLPCCTTDAMGSKNGDPVNFILVGSDDDVLGALTRQGWDFPRMCLPPEPPGRRFGLSSKVTPTAIPR